MRNGQPHTTRPIHAMTWEQPYDPCRRLPLWRLELVDTPFEAAPFEARIYHGHRLIVTIQGTDLEDISRAVARILHQRYHWWNLPADQNDAEP